LYRRPLGLTSAQASAHQPARDMVNPPSRPAREAEKAVGRAGDAIIEDAMSITD